MKHIDKYNEFLNEGNTWENIAIELDAAIQLLQTGKDYTKNEISTILRKFESFTNFHYMIIFYLFVETKLNTFQFKIKEEAIPETILFIIDNIRNKQRKERAVYYNNNKDSYKEYREKNKEHLQLYRKEYYKKNKEKITAYKKEWAERNKERLLNKRKLYYLENKDKMYASSKKWKEKNPEKVAAWKKRWREENSEKVKATYKKWAAENSERKKASSKKWAAENSEKIKAASKKWAAANPEKIKAASKIAMKRSYAKKRSQMIVSVLEFIDTILHLETEEFKEQLYKFIITNVFKKHKRSSELRDSLIHLYLYEDNNFYKIDLGYANLSKEEAANDLYTKVWPGYKEISENIYEEL